MTKEHYRNIAGEQGTVKIAETVIVSIAKQAAAEVQGVSGVAEGLTQNLQALWKQCAAAQGFKVRFYGNRVSVDLSILVEYGYIVPEVAKKVQEAVQTAIQSMAGLQVESVGISVQGIVFPQQLAWEDAGQEPI